MLPKGLESFWTASFCFSYYTQYQFLEKTLKIRGSFVWLFSSPFSDFTRSGAVYLELLWNIGCLLNVPPGCSWPLCVVSFYSFPSNLCSTAELYVLLFTFGSVLGGCCREGNASSGHTFKVLKHPAFNSLYQNQPRAMELWKDHRTVKDSLMWRQQFPTQNQTLTWWDFLLFSSFPLFSQVDYSGIQWNCGIPMGLFRGLLSHKSLLNKPSALGCCCSCYSALGHSCTSPHVVPGSLDCPRQLDSIWPTISSCFWADPWWLFPSVI